MISNWTKNLWSPWFVQKYFSAARATAVAPDERGAHNRKYDEEKVRKVTQAKWQQSYRITVGDTDINKNMATTQCMQTYLWHKLLMVRRKWTNWASGQTGRTGPREPPEDGEMNQMPYGHMTPHAMRPTCNLMICVQPSWYVTYPHDM